MIIDKLIDLLLKIPLMLIDSLPNIELSFSETAFNGLETFFGNVAYALPVLQLLPILIISYALMVFRVAWAVVIRVKSFIPTMGS